MRKATESRDKLMLVFGVSLALAEMGLISRSAGEEPPIVVTGSQLRESPIVVHGTRLESKPEESNSRKLFSFRLPTTMSAEDVRVFI